MAEPYLRSQIRWQILNRDVWIPIRVSYTVTVRLSGLVLDVFVCDRQTDGQMDNADRYYSWFPHCGGPANKTDKTVNETYK